MTDVHKKKIYFWAIQVLLVLLFGFFSFYCVSYFVYHDILRLTVEKFNKSPLFYLSIPVGAFFLLCFIDFLAVLAIKFARNKKNTGSNGREWAKKKHEILFVLAIISLWVFYLILSYILAFLLLYLPYLLSLLNIHNINFDAESFYFLRMPFTLLIFFVFFYRYVRRNLFTLDSTENAVKRFLKFERKVIRTGLNLLWKPFEDVIVISREKMELEFIVSNIRTKPGREEMYEYIDEDDNKTKMKYDEVDRQDIIMHIGVQVSFSDDEDCLFKAVQFLPVEILYSMQLTHIINKKDIADVKRYIPSEETEDLKEGSFVVPENRLKIVRAGLIRTYDSMIEGYIKAKAADMTYPQLDREKIILANGILEILKADETFKSTGLSDKLNVYIREIIIPEVVQESARQREVASKTKQATISIAEGNKKAAELKALGDQALGIAQAKVEAAKKEYELKAYKDAYDMTNSQAIEYDLTRRVTEALGSMNLTAFDTESIAKFVKNAAKSIVEEMKNK